MFLATTSSDLQPKPLVADLLHMGRRGVLKRGIKVGIAEALQALTASVEHLTDTGQTFMLEVFSGEGHFTIRAVQGGHTAGQPLDIRYSVDLKDLSAMIQLCEWIERYKPWVVSIAFPCTAYSRLNIYLNAHLAPRFAKQRREAYVFLELARDVSVMQVSNGRLSIIENPFESLAWKERPMVELLDDPRFVKLRLDQCMVNLRDISWPFSLFRKGTGLVVPANTALENVGIKCDRSHLHSWIIGGKKSTPAGVWTVELGELFIGAATQEAATVACEMRTGLMAASPDSVWCGEIRDADTRRLVANGLYLRPSVLRVFRGLGVGDD